MTSFRTVFDRQYISKRCLFDKLEGGGIAMLRFAVCEEEMFARKKIVYGIRQSLYQLNEEAEIIEFVNGNELRSAVKAQKSMDAVFLDTELNGMDGIKLGAWLRKQQWNNLLIYVSGREDRVFQSFQAHPFRFIRKSHFQQEIIPTVKDLLSELRKQNGKFLVLQSGGQTYRIDPYDIIYVESQRKKQCIYTEQQELEINDTFRELLELLKPYGFLQIHRSYAVNYRYVQSFRGNNLKLDNQMQLPVGRQRLSEVKEEFQQLCLA